jgi:hypothetical protein
LFFSFIQSHVHWAAHNLLLSPPTWTTPARRTRTARTRRTVWLQWVQDANKFGVLTAWLETDKLIDLQTLSLCRSHNTQQLILPDLTHNVSGPQIPLFVHTNRYVRVVMWRSGSVVFFQGASVYITLPHGSLYVFRGHAVRHGTTRQRTPNRLFPQRIALVFYRLKPTSLAMEIFVVALVTCSLP